MPSKKILSIITFLIVLLSSVTKVNSIEPDVFVQSTVNRAAKTLSGNLTKEERISELKKIAKETVDIRGVGLYSLGSFRKTLNNEQNKRYEQVFEQYFLKSFASRLAEYSNPEIEVVSKTKVNENYTMVNSKLVATDTRPEVKIDWRVYTKNPDRPLIRDLIVEGLSMARVQKEEFASILSSNNNDIKILINKLEEFINN